MKADHRAVEQLFNRFPKTTGAKTKENLVNKIIRELSIHAAIEEMIVYPAMRRNLPNGDALVDHALQEHQEAKETLRELEKMSAEDESFDENVMSLIDDVTKHVEEEETELFPQFRDSMSREELVQLGDALKMAKKTAPTRPHPRAPNKPPGNLANLLASVVDRTRDAARRRAG